MQNDKEHRASPRDMQKGAPQRGKEKPEEKQPTQMPVTDEEVVRPPAKWKKVLARVLFCVLLIVALAVGYIFLLLGEPDEEAKLTAPEPEETISMPMSAVEAHGDANIQSIADAFNRPILVLYGSELTMQKARVYDTAFGGGYARRTTLSYALPDGAQLNVESIRPTAAAALLSGDGYKLETGSLYSLGGMNAALMRGGESVCVFAQSDSAVYAVVCPPGHDELLKTLLKQTRLIAPASSEQ